MAASAKKARRAVVAGAEHTDAGLAAMKTSEIAALVALRATSLPIRT